MRPILALLAGLIVGLAAPRAEAGLSFCNKADVAHSFAVAWKDGDDWRVEGWWNIEPGECSRVVGGDLTQRYYYWRATAAGREFSGDDFYFCTDSNAFTITGEQGNCAARGHDRSEFKQLDTGQSAKEFTLNLLAADDSPAPDPAPPPAPDASAPGTYGEPYSDAAIFQDCASEGDAEFCTFHAGGTKFYIYDDGRTPRAVFTTMRSLLPGATIAVEGDLVEVFDSTAEVVLRRVDIRTPDRFDTILERMQGSWYSVDDPNNMINIIGAEQENRYDGDLISLDYLSIRDWCDDYPGGGPFLYARTEGTEDYYCYGIEHVDQLEMLLIYLPRGNFLTYRKLD